MNKLQGRGTNITHNYHIVHIRNTIESVHFSFPEFSPNQRENPQKRGFLNKYDILLWLTLSTIIIDSIMEIGNVSHNRVSYLLRKPRFFNIYPPEVRNLKLFIQNRVELCSVTNSNIFYIKMNVNYHKIWVFYDFN